MASNSGLKTTVVSGFEKSSAYDQHRPSFSSTAVEHLLKVARISKAKGARILEIGAGTGKFTELLAARDEEYEILAVEPHDSMRRVLENKKLRGVSVVKGSANDLGQVPNGWADAVVVAQAFHWFAELEALQEFHKKVVPRGVLVLIWNIEDYNSEKSFETTTEWEQKLNDILWATDDEDPRFRHEKWRHVFDEQVKSSPFTIQTADPLFSLPIGEWSETWTQEAASRIAVWERFSTLSQIASMKDEQLEEIKKQVFKTLDSPDVEQSDNGAIAIHGRTIVAFTSAIPTETLRQGG